MDGIEEFAELAEQQRIEDRIDALNEAANALEDSIVDPHVLFDPIMAIHTTATWQGLSANLSRDRLDEQWARTLHIAATIRTLIEDLRHAANVERSRLHSR